MKIYKFVNRSRNSLRVSKAAIHKNVYSLSVQFFYTKAMVKSPLSLPAIKFSFVSVFHISFHSKSIYCTLPVTAYILVLNSFLNLSLFYSFSSFSSFFFLIPEACPESPKIHNVTTMMLLGSQPLTTVSSFIMVMCVLWGQKSGLEALLPLAICC